MTVNRISTLSTFQTVINDFGKVQRTLAEEQEQLSSGYKSSDFTGIYDRSAEMLNVQAQIDRADRFVTNNNISLAKLQSASGALTKIVDIVSSLKNLVSQRITGVANSDNFGAQLQAQWKALTAALNTSSNNESLFGGSATDGPAVRTDVFPTTALPGVPDKNYYLGSSQDRIVRSQEGVEFTANIRADDPAFQKIFAGLSQANLGDVEGSNNMLKQAYDLLDAGLQGVITLQAVVNTNDVTLRNTNEELEATKLAWGNIVSEINGTDVVAVSTQVAVNQGILQAAFQAFAKINALKLSDYLR